MSFANTYFSRFNALPQQIQEPTHAETKLIVCIPCYNEPDILVTLQSLLESHTIEVHTEIIVVVNQSETVSAEISEFNRKTYVSLVEFANTNTHTYCKIHPIFAENIPQKQAGVGYARKLAMDEAVRRFNSIENEKGIIICCDADSTVAKNYFKAIYTFYTLNPDCMIANVHFEHPLQGNLQASQYNAIAQYELYLRLYVEALRKIKFPFAYHTVGSSCTVRAIAYCRQGGMNKRQAGEDFYFLQKLFQSEQTGEITNTCIFPSARISNRVPFGTGFAMKQLMEAEQPIYLCYRVESFNVLDNFFSIFPELFNNTKLEKAYNSLHISLQDFIGFAEFSTKIQEAQKNTSNQEMFVKRMFIWFNGFMVFKYLNFAHTTYFTKEAITDVAAKFLNKPADTIALLEFLREKQRVR